MLQGWVIIAVALAYVGLLFLVASYGDRTSSRPRSSRGRPTIYALSIGVYCTSWTFFGAVGLASTRGLGFVTIYLGPIIAWTIGYPLIRRIIRLAKAEHITSIADFLGSRYGKNQSVAATVSLIAVVATLPYIALQLKAISSSVMAMMDYNHGSLGNLPIVGDPALLLALSLAMFAVLFGTRHIDATEHQEGLILAVAAESVVKLICLTAVGAYVTFGFFDGPADLWAKASAASATRILDGQLGGGNLIAETLLSLFAILLLPRQFHVSVVENNSDHEIRRARWMFPGYLVAINLFVIPIALAGLTTFGAGSSGDLFVLTLPMQAGNEFMTLVAFVGGLSAATAMVIVASVALSIMISNDVVVPLILRRRPSLALFEGDIGGYLLVIRRMVIFALLIGSYIYYRLAGNSAALASIGFLSFAAISQLAPAIFLGLVWRGATARGAIAGMLGGFAMWLYTLMLPTLVTAGLVSDELLRDGPLHIGFLRPQALFGIAFDPLTHGVFWSLTVNLFLLFLVSLMREPKPIERAQASVFVPTPLSPTPTYRLWRTAVTVDDLQSTVARYIGEERLQRSFARYERERGIKLSPLAPASIDLIHFAEQLLASAVGAASSRLVLSLLMKRRDPATRGAMKLLDDASAAIQHSRELMQIALDQVAQGIAVFNSDYLLISWNRRFRDLLDLPAEFGQVGTPLVDILRHAGGPDASGSAQQSVLDRRIDRILRHGEVLLDMHQRRGLIVELRSSPMPDGGLVITATDMTERVASERELARVNETLEGRVRERTEALVAANEALAEAKVTADEANLGKTRFLAAASHDILQPLNAARLFTTSLIEKKPDALVGELADNIHASLESVEEILGAVLDISRLDAGALKSEMTSFRLDEILRPLRLEFEPMARDKGLEFHVVMSTATIRSDRRLLRRLLQNLISNAIKYTQSGRVLVGCRHQKDRLLIQIIDTGIGIPLAKQKEIFQEFQRLESGARVAKGLGLGLSIVERIARVLDHDVTVRSAPKRGSLFQVTVPVTAALPAFPVQSAPAEATAGDLRGLKLVCIDNEPAILEGMRHLLTGWGCHVVTAPDVRQAISALKAEALTPDVLLLDYHLDEGTGIDAAVQLRWLFGAEIPAILITANRLPDLRDQAAAKDISLLFKPLKPAALRALLTQQARRLTQVE